MGIIIQKMMGWVFIVGLLIFFSGLSSLNLAEKLLAFFVIISIGLFALRLITKDLIPRDKLEMEIKKVDELKSDAIRDVSHEFRNNISFIFNAVGLLKDEVEKSSPDKRRIRELFNTISMYSRRFESQISSILQFGMLERMEDTEKEKVDVPAIINNVVKEHGEVAKEKGLKIITKIEKVPYMLGNSELIRTLVRNLVSNAVKFTDKGCVRIACKKQDNDMMILVEDTGVGIKKENIEKLFRPYSKLDPLKDGIGVGLVICKKIVNLHKGTIKVESKLGKGTKFTILIPIRAC